MDGGKRLDVGLYPCSECFGMDGQSILSVLVISTCSFTVVMVQQTYGKSDIEAWHVVISVIRSDRV